MTSGAPRRAEDEVVALAHDPVGIDPTGTADPGGTPGRRVAAARPAGRRRSAGILLWRRAGDGLEVLVAHPGGPLWARRTTGAWSVPKGEYGPQDDPFAAAVREFAEELGHPAPADGYVALGSVTQAGGKVVTVWAVEGDLDPATCVSDTFELEWPPRSGIVRSYPEVDRVAWMAPVAAKAALVPAQAELVDRLVAQVLGEG